MYIFIANPISGNMALAGLQDRLKKKLASKKILDKWVQSNSPNEIGPLVKQAITDGYTTIIAVGGDDTLNEVINHAVGNDNLAIGVIPIGTNNRLATRLGINNWQDACKIVAARRITNYSLLAAGQKYFLSSLEIGFETELDKIIDASSSSTKATINRTFQGINQAHKYQTIELDMVVDGKYSMSGNIFSLAITNLRYLNPEATNKLMIESCDHPGRLIQVNKYVFDILKNRQTTVSDREVDTRLYANHVTIKTNPTSSVMADGKIIGRTPLAIRLTDQTIKIITDKRKNNFDTSS